MFSISVLIASYELLPLIIVVPRPVAVLYCPPREKAPVPAAADWVPKLNALLVAGVVLAPKLNPPADCVDPVVFDA